MAMVVQVGLIVGGGSLEGWFNYHDSWVWIDGYVQYANDSSDYTLAWAIEDDNGNLWATCNGIYKWQEAEKKWLDRTGDQARTQIDSIEKVTFRSAGFRRAKKTLDGTWRIVGEVVGIVGTDGDHGKTVADVFTGKANQYLTDMNHIGTMVADESHQQCRAAGKIRQ